MGTLIRPLNITDMKKITRTFIYVFTLVLFNSTIYSQSVSYDDVAVIVNDSSAASIAIGNYYQTKHSIPAKNMIHVVTSLDETIDSTTFENLRAQIEAHLITEGIVDSITYLVTTKGVPFRVEKTPGDCDTGGPFFSCECNSVESELSLILGPLSSYILNGRVFHPYFYSDSLFDRAIYGFYLVSRLDGYTVSDVYQLIDAGGPDNVVHLPDANWILDYAGLSSASDSAIFHHLWIDPARDTLTNHGCSVIHDTDNSDLLAPQTGVSGLWFMSYDSIPSGYSHHWLPGSIVSNPMTITNTFYDSLKTSSFIPADLIADGIAGYAGVVKCSFTSVASHPQFLFGLYTDTTQIRPYTLGECFYGSNPAIPDGEILIGDPKTTIRLSPLADKDKPALSEFQLYPNPNNGVFRLKWSTPPSGNKELSITDLHGRMLYSRQITSQEPLDMKIELINPPAGMYFVRIKTDQGIITKKFVMTP